MGHGALFGKTLLAKAGSEQCVNQSKSCGANGCDQTECCVADATCGDVDGGGETIITCYAKTKHLVSSPSIDWQQHSNTSIIDQKFDDFLFLIVVVFLTGKQKYDAASNTNECTDVITNKYKLLSLFQLVPCDAVAKINSMQADRHPREDKGTEVVVLNSNHNAQTSNGDLAKTYEVRSDSSPIKYPTLILTRNSVSYVQLLHVKQHLQTCSHMCLNTNQRWSLLQMVEAN